MTKDVAYWSPRSLANGFVSVAKVTREGEPLRPWEWDKPLGAVYVRVQDYEQLAAELRLAESARDYANDMLDRQRGAHEPGAVHPQGPYVEPSREQHDRLLAEAMGLSQRPSAQHFDPASVPDCPRCGVAHWPQCPEKS